VFCFELKDIAAADLPSTHPIRLGLALNFSVFYYEILNQSDKACAMAKQVCLFMLIIITSILFFVYLISNNLFMFMIYELYL
jgi:hypothetical protein